MSTDNTVEKQNEKPWLFKKGQSGNPNGRPKGTFSLKTFAKKYLQEMTDEEKEAFMEGLPKEIIWKMAEGNPAQDTTLSGGIDTEGNLKPVLVKFIDGNSTDNRDTSGVQATV